MTTLQNEPVSKFIPVVVAVAQVIITSDLIRDGATETSLYLVALPVVLFYVLWFRKKKVFSAQIVGVGALLVFVFLKYLYSLGVQLPGKGEGDSLLPISATLAFGYAALTMAVACLFLYLIQLASDKRE